MAYEVGSDALLFTDKWERCTIVERKGRSEYSVQVGDAVTLRDADAKDMKRLVTKRFPAQDVATRDGVVQGGKMAGWRVYTMDASHVVAYPFGRTGDFNWLVAHLQGFFDDVSCEDDAYTTAEAHIGKEDQLLKLLKGKYTPKQISRGLMWLDGYVRSNPVPIAIPVVATRSRSYPVSDIEKLFRTTGSTHSMVRGDTQFVFDDSAQKLTISRTHIFCCFISGFASKKVYPYSDIVGIRLGMRNSYGCWVRKGGRTQHFYYLRIRNAPDVILDGDVWHVASVKCNAFSAWLSQRAGREMPALSDPYPYK
eukprot:TRINITY_DN2159_c0_g1_i1.p1 TRINITY_DN2159_c0_g1~~TRINITY_DN2159_c0_g1_i1.p1  ORF type:complete len:324 (+),score=65.66 TRINITY_DN2159_c0_g1_i1:48-974(+)